MLDGDTLAVSVALPHYQMGEKLRLRGFDCPEMDTPEGKAAKRFVDMQLLDAREVVLTTSKIDKYDRYLADVHATRPDGAAIYLNNELLKNAHACQWARSRWTSGCRDNDRPRGPPSSATLSANSCQTRR